MAVVTLNGATGVGGPEVGVEVARLLKADYVDRLLLAEAAKRARDGDGPTLLELRTYRYKGHSMSDPAKYRTREEVDEYRQKDPIEQIKKEIFSKKLATEKELVVIEDGIKKKIEDAVKFAEESPYPDPSESLKDVYEQKDYTFTTD